MKHTIKILLAFILLTGSTPTHARKPHDTSGVRNVILMIGDGMGLAQTGALMIESGYRPLSFDRAQYIGLSKTYSANNRVTDSAASATAMATGHKTANSRIGMTADSIVLVNITELAETNGLSTGIVVTSHLADATPAGFAAHTPYRYNSEQITAAYANSGIDVLAGGGRQFFEQSLDGRSIIEEMQARGYSYAATPEEFSQIETLPILGLFADKYMPMADERGEKYLAEMTKHTLDLLSRNSKGFFAMIEGSQIDRACHKNDIKMMLAEMRDFDNAVNAAFDFADTHPGTLVIVAADHETGGLTMVAGDADFTASESGIDYKFSTGSHSGIPVVLYAYGTGAARFSGVMENTDIFHRIKALLIDKK